MRKEIGGTPQQLNAGFFLKLLQQSDNLVQVLVGLINVLAFRSYIVPSSQGR
jgi:hypothetical protein